MKNKIYTTNKQKKIEITPADRAVLKRAINAALLHENVPFDSEISVSFTDNEGIRELNREYREKDSETDVLSFPLYEKSEIASLASENGENVPLGDIVISLEKAKAQAESYGHSFDREISFLAVHSILHLLGYDHEVSEHDEKDMNDASEEILSSIGLTRDNTISDTTLQAENIDEQDNIPLDEMMTGFISIIGRPNVGKSTLMNAILGEKVAIVSKKPQTTRNRITGVLTKGNCQYVFLDTPGIHKPKTKLGEFMMKSADSTIAGTDLIVFMVEPTEFPNKAEHEIADKINASKLPCILVINKVDAFKKDKLLVTIDKFSKLCDFKSIVPISALQNDGVDIVMTEITPFLKKERWYFPPDVITDQPDRQIAAEIIREKLLRLLDDEIPHGIAVVIEDFKEKKDIIEIRAEIYCEKEAHKRIIIGKNGDTLKKAATYAREDMEAFYAKKVYLNLWVKVKENWRDNIRTLNSLGYKDE